MSVLTDFYSRVLSIMAGTERDAAARATRPTKIWSDYRLFRSMSHFLTKLSFVFNRIDLIDT